MVADSKHSISYLFSWSYLVLKDLDVIHLFFAVLGAMLIHPTYAGIVSAGEAF